MTQINLKKLNQFLYNDDIYFNYNKNKPNLFTFLKLLQFNKKLSSQQEMRRALATKLKSVHDLRKTQEKIHFRKLDGKSVSFLHPILFKFQAIAHFFQKIFYGKYRLKGLIKLTKKIEKADPMPDFKRDSIALKKFKNLAKKLQPIAVGNLVKGTIALDKDYWLETIKLRLMIDRQIFEGHLYTGYLITQEKYMEKWKNECDECGSLYCEKFTFEDYMNNILIPHLSSKEKEELKAKLSIVEYFTTLELADFEARFDEEGRVYTANSSLNQWIDFKGQNPDSKLSYKEFRESNICSFKKNDESQSILQDQTYLYVLDHQERLFLQIKNRGRINHTSLSNGHAVLAAGSLKVKNGNITEIDTFSGHYKPTAVQLKNVLSFLKRLHVHLDQIKVTYVAEYAVQPWVIREIESKNVLAWLNQE